MVDTVFEKVLVSREDRPPRIREYRGHGTLVRWVRVVSARTAVDELRTRRWRETAVADDAVGVGLEPPADPELALLRDHYAADFRGAFRTRRRQLDDRDRRVLRERIVYGLGIVRMAELHETSKSSMARWIDAARNRLVAHVRHDLQARLAVGSDDLESLLRLAGSQFHVSVARVLRSE